MFIPYRRNLNDNPLLKIAKDKDKYKTREEQLYNSCKGNLAGMFGSIGLNLASFLPLAYSGVDAGKTIRPEDAKNFHDVATKMGFTGNIGEAYTHPSGIKVSLQSANDFLRNSGNIIGNQELLNNSFATPAPGQPQNMQKANEFVVALGKNGTLRKPGIIAHELGHVVQSRQKPWSISPKISDMRAHATPAAVLGSLGVLYGNIMGRDGTLTKEESDNVQLGSALAGTALNLPVVFNEAQASYNGSKAFKGLSKLKPFAGLTSYASLAAMPLLTYASGKLMNGDTDE